MTKDKFKTGVYATCVNRDRALLTEGKLYLILTASVNKVTIINDDGVCTEYRKSRFKLN